MNPQLLRELEILHNGVCVALGDLTRLRLLYALRDGEQNVGDLAEMLKLPQPTVSRHLKVLREREMAVTRREGTTVFYALGDERIIAALDLLREFLRDRLAGHVEVMGAGEGE